MGDGVSIIIPQRGHQHRLTEPLVSALRQHEPDAEILVIDDGAGRLKSPSDIEGVRMLHNEGRGLTAAWNRGCRWASHRHLVLLNNDVICLGPFLSKLVPRSECGIAGSVMRGDEDLALFVLEGWCLAFTQETYHTLGGFDETMNLYFSDTDFQARAHKRGLPLTSVPLPMLRHLGHRTAHDKSILPDRAKQWQSDRREFCRKWEIPE